MSEDAGHPRPGDGAERAQKPVGASGEERSPLTNLPAGWLKRLRWMIRTTLGTGEDAEGVAGHLLRGAAGTAGIQVAAMALAFLTSVLLARLLGPAGYGAFTFAVALLHLLAIPASLGMTKLLIRNVSTYTGRSEPALTAGLLHRADQLTLTTGIATTVLALSVSLIIADGQDRVMMRAFWMILPALPMLVLIRVKQAALQGLKRIVRGQLPEGVLLPGLFLLLALVWWALPVLSLDPITAVGLNVLATAVALYTALLLLRKHLPASIEAAEPQFRTREWIASALPLLLVSGLHVINSRTDVIMLGAIKGAESVGLYNVAARGSSFVGFFLAASGRALGPTIASLYDEEAIHKLQGLLTGVIRLVVFLTLPIAATFILFGDWILGFVYGTAFTDAHSALAILSTAELLAVAMGSVSLLLVMTGHEREAAFGVGLSAVLNIVLNATLIPYFGLTGAAVATGLSMVVWNIVFAIVATRQVGVNCTILSSPR